MKKFCSQSIRRAKTDKNVRLLKSLPLLRTVSLSKSVRIAVSEAVKMIHSIEESRNTLPEYSVVKDMDYIGDTLAPRIIAEIGDVRCFRNKHSLIVYADIEAPPYQSGLLNASERYILKRGNKYIRKRSYGAGLNKFLRVYYGKVKELYSSKWFSHFFNTFQAKNKKHIR